MDAAVASALESLRVALAASQGRRPAYLMLLYPDGSTELHSLGSTIAGDVSGRQAGRVAPELTDREKAALAVLAKAVEPLKGRTVATRAGLRYTSHFREMMSGLVGKELVIVGPEGGYWPAGRPLPRAPDR